MITVDRDNKGVQILIDTDLPSDDESGEVEYIFRCNLTEAAGAELLRRYVQNRLASAIKRSHERAYEQGWTDHRKKARKKENFSTVIDSPEIGW